VRQSIALIDGDVVSDAIARVQHNACQREQTRVRKGPGHLLQRWNNQLLSRLRDARLGIDPDKMSSLTHKE
jgi:hypothetical protein